jgi:hypothetical protein
MRNYNLTLLVLITTLFLTSCKKYESLESAQNPFNIQFNLLCNGEKLTPNVQYLNKSSELYSISAFKIYIGDITLSNTITQQKFTSSQYHLLNSLDSTSLIITQPLNKGTYNQLSFTIGIDSVHSVSGSQTDALDPINGMFWTWNTGYINAKLEGASPSSTAVGKTFTYHIGGFKSGENTQRIVFISLPPSLFINLDDGFYNEIVLDVNLEQWFQGNHNVSIAATPTITTPGGLAIKIADNYATLFSFNRLITR